LESHTTIKCNQIRQSSCGLLQAIVNLLFKKKKTGKKNYKCGGELWQLHDVLQHILIISEALFEWKYLKLASCVMEYVFTCELYMCYVNCLIKENNLIYTILLTSQLFSYNGYRTYYTFIHIWRVFLTRISFQTDCSKRIFLVVFKK
jgi:hypothetical protein